MHHTADRYPGEGLGSLRVRIPRYYHSEFIMKLGQRNARMVEGSMLSRWRHDRERWIDPGAFTFATARGCDMMHTSNMVPLLTRVPYIVTFEDWLPRVPQDKHQEWLLRVLRWKLLRPQCRAIVAYSRFGMRQMRRQNQGYRRLAELEGKARVIYPGVRQRYTEPKKHSDGLRLLFVSSRFMGKAGPALVRAHERLRASGVPVQTVIVSRLEWSPDDFIGPMAGYDIEAEHARIDQPGIRLMRGLSNDRVIELMRWADYFIFPTLYDTFGIAPVEALSCGTPAICTDTAAQPEIVEDGVCGYLLPFENDPQLGRWAHLYRTDRRDYNGVFARTMESLAESLERTLARCWANRSGYEQLSAAAIERVRARFGRERARDELEPLYELCRRSR